MGRLHLKETPEEREERKRRKWRKAERKAHQRIHSHTQGRASQRARADTDGHLKGDIGTVEEEEEGWMPPQGSTKRDIDLDEVELRREVEERLFREKLFDAMGEEDADYAHRLDGLEARLNDYGHVPNRWRTHASAGDGRNLFEHASANPNEMTDDEYAEWIRSGMWRRTHKAEIEEKERKQAERKARMEEQRKIREETARLERQREAERKVRRQLKEERQRRDAWDYYEARWNRCTSAEVADQSLKFQDIPWPVFSVPSATEDLTTERISVFLLYGLDGETETKTRKERIREALLRWHPDKFEGKMGAKLDIHDRDRVLDGVGIVARCLLMAT